MSSIQVTETVNVGRLTVTNHRGRSADLLCFRASALCFSEGHGHGHGHGSRGAGAALNG